MLPAVIPIVSSLALYAPQIATNLMIPFAINVVARVSAESISNRVSVSNSALQAIADALKDPSSQANLATLLLIMKDEIKNGLLTNDTGEGSVRVADILDAMRDSSAQMAEVVQGGMMAQVPSSMPGMEGFTEEKGLAQVVFEKECGIRDATLQINISSPEDALINGYSETWTMFS